jgi:hypothetical protein
MRIIIAVALAALSLAISAHAQIGRAVDECRQSYGNGEYLPKTDAYMFYPLINRVRYFICAYLVDGKGSEDKPNQKVASGPAPTPR